MDNKNINEEVYNTVVVGGGIAGLTTAYMLRDRNIIVLDKENRLGGRVLSEKVNEATNNIGTQFLSEGNSSFCDLLDELEIKRYIPNLKTSPLALYLNNRYYPDAKSYINLKVIFQAIKMLFISYRRYLTSKLPSDSPKWQKLAAQTTHDIQKGMGKEVLALVNIFLRASCLTKPERTSAITGAGFMGSAAESGSIAFVEGGFQKVTDAMVSKLNGKIMCNTEIYKIVETDGIVSVSYKKDGKEFNIKSKAVVIAAPAPEVLKFLPNITPNKKRALEMIKYGPITMVSVYLKRTIPWRRFSALLSDNTFFQGVIDQTMGIEEDNNPENPILYNFIISHYPDETDEIKEFLAKSDQEILEETLDDFKKMVPQANNIEDYITGNKVTRYPIGELELSPEYFLESLPYLQKPMGNIHFCGDYTEAESFVDAAVHSGFRVARELGSRLVVSKKDEKKVPTIPRWGIWGFLTMFLNILLIICGVFLPGVSGLALTIGAALLFMTTLLLPSFFPPFKQLYQLLLGITTLFGGTIGLIIKFIN